MSTALTTRLTGLAAAIVQEHQRCEGNYRTALQHAVRAGQLLSEAKAQLTHGEWLPWLGEHTPLSARTAQTYMQLAAHPNAQAPAHLSIEDALSAIAKPAAPAPAVDPAPSTDLRATFKDIDPAALDAAMAELNLTPEESRFPESGMERETWRQINDALRRIVRAMDEASAGGLSKWSRREALQEGSRHARHVASQLSELADTLAV